MSYTVNTLSTIAPILLREGLLALRENSIMAQLCQFDVSKEAAQKGAVINVEIPSVVPAQEVNVSTANTATALAPTVVPVVLDNWWETVFSMSDKDYTEVLAGTLPASASEAIKSLANKVDTSCLSVYKDVYGYVGDAASTPDAVGDITLSRMTLNTQLAPIPGNRVLLIDPYAEEKFLLLDTFNEVNKSGTTAAQVEGSLGKKFGFEIFMDQNMPYHTKGTLAAAGGGAIAATATVAIGLKAATLDQNGTGTLTGTLVVGDVLTFAGDTQTYVITTAAEASGDAITIAFEPGLKVALANGTLATLKGSRRINLAFDKQAFCFVSRPLQIMNGLGSIIDAIVDPISGLTLRLEISRVNKTTRFSYDILWGKKTIRREYASVLAG